MLIQALKWDSDFFKLPIARVDIESYEDVLTLAQNEESLKDSYKLIYIFAPQQLEFSIKNAKLVDQKVHFKMSPLSGGTHSNKIKEIVSGAVSEELIELALISGRYSRFKTDDMFPPHSYEQLYSYWIKESVNKHIATEVFCYMSDGKPHGLVTLNRFDKEISIGLLAVTPCFQHQGIGSALIQHVVSFAQNRCYSALNVSTQLCNVPACKLYSKSGFAISSIKKIWHWWL